VDTYEELGLFAARVDALGHEDHADAEKLELLENTRRVHKHAAEAARVIHQDYVERSRFLPRYTQKPLQARAIVRRSGDCFVRIVMFVQDSQTAESGVFAAFPDLLVNGERVLLLVGVASVDGATCGLGHGLTALSFRAAVLLTECAASEASPARSFSPSVAARYCFTRTGTIARSMNSFSSGVRADPLLLCLLGTI